MSSLVDVLSLGNPESAKPLVPFHKDILALLNDVSTTLMKTAEAKRYPDIITFAFFCRKANLEQIKKEWKTDEKRIGRGLTFHIAPSNVPVNFAYSLISGLLAGNPCIVKASSKDYPQTRIICRVFEQLLSDSYRALKDYIRVVMYPREDQKQTAAFSSACAVRILWGGDQTINTVREIPIPPRAFDVTFSDRYSILCIRAEALLCLSTIELAKISKDFYNDTFLTDQNACTSPRLIYWVGQEEQVKQAQEVFWTSIYTEAAKRYTVEPIIAVDKLCAACTSAIEMNGVTQRMPDNLIVRTKIPALSAEIEKNRAPGGYFIEYSSDRLEDLAKVVSTRYQTMSQLGFSNGELRTWIVEHNLSGIDRVCSIGHTMDFSLVWDGYDLIRTLSRQIG